MEKIFIRLCNFHTRTPRSIPRSIPKSSLRLSFRPGNSSCGFPRHCLKGIIPMSAPHSQRLVAQTKPKHTHRGPTNALHKRAKTIIPRTQVRSYRERSCDHTESVRAFLPTAQRRSYKERPHHLDIGDGGVHSERLRERLLSRVLPSLKRHYEEPWDTIHYRLV